VLDPSDDPSGIIEARLVVLGVMVLPHTGQNIEAVVDILAYPHHVAIAARPNDAQAWHHAATRAGHITSVYCTERMACGIGACLACMVPTTHGQRHVCIDGPVFPGVVLYAEHHHD
jgi:hypothetical protein